VNALTVVAPDDPRQAIPPKCFVIGPIGDKYKDPGTPERRLYEEALRVYDEVVCAACHEHGLVPVRADAIADTGEITDQIHRRLQEDDIVIADVSGANPNVTYELGFRIGRGKPVILIGESGTLPFDIAQLRTIRFRRTESSLHEARDQLSRVLREGLTQGFRTYSNIGAISPHQEVAAEGNTDEEEDDEPGLVDLLAHAEMQMETVLRDIEAMGDALLSIAAAAEECTPEAEALGESGAPASARLALVKKFSTAVEEPAATFRTSSEAFAGRMTDIEGGIQALFDIIEERSPEERDEDNKQFLQQVIDLVESTRTGMTNITEFGSSMGTVVSYSRLLRAPGRNIAAAVRNVQAVADRIDVLERRARTLLNAAPPDLAQPAAS
jgi:nucleoside 2-deoxyribosyltransferase